MDAIEFFGSVAVVAMVVCYALEARGTHFVLLFAGACAASSLYAALIAAWPFALVEAVWAGIAVRRWCRARQAECGDVRVMKFS